MRGYSHGEAGVANPRGLARNLSSQSNDCRSAPPRRHERHTTTYSYDDRYRLSTITTGYTGSTVQSLSYTWAENGNLDTVIDSVAGETINYHYDDLDRILDMDVNGNTVASYGYDPNVTYGGKIGNMTTKTEGATTYNFGYASEHIHAPSSHGGYTNVYDKNGNST